MGEFLPSDLREMFDGLMDLYDLAYEEIRRDVEIVILNGIKDEEIIAHIFDNILNVPTERCFELFNDLCDYTSTFNQGLVDDYIDIYNDLYGDDDIQNTKKM